VSSGTSPDFSADRAEDFTVRTAAVAVDGVAEAQAEGAGLAACDAEIFRR
jgi:hypothetical protein